jgi:poly(hydroxyalkanoate) depolymerase family esterase
MLAGQIVGGAARSWLSFLPTDRANSHVGRVIEVTDFGSNPGNLRMFVYAPSRRIGKGAPLIVVLHGCGQSAASFAAETGWVALAEQRGASLLLPEQKRDNNRGNCFNWYRPGDVRRGEGEAHSVRQMVRAATERFGSDPKRIFIVGLSAGGAMTAALLAAYPTVFNAGAVIAGMPVGAAFNGTTALLRMHRAEQFRGASALADSVRSAAPVSKSRLWPRLSIWQGGNDRVVDPANAERLALQWCTLHGFSETATSDTMPLPGARRRVWNRRERALIELWTIEGFGHGVPMDVRSPGYAQVGSGVPYVGVSAADHIARFWRL